MPTTLPYVFSTSALKKVLDKIRAAAVPEKFTQNFLADTLGMKGGNNALLIPYLKKIGFLNGDGSPTEIYKRFRNESASKAAMADAIRIGYGPLFTMNEAAYKLNDAALEGLVVQATGLPSDSSALRGMISCFKLLKGMADFSVPQETALTKKQAHETKPELPTPPTSGTTGSQPDGAVGINLSYTINLQLPATTDLDVFNAIFRSLKENLLKR